MGRGLGAIIPPFSNREISKTWFLPGILSHIDNFPQLKEGGGVQPVS